ARLASAFSICRAFWKSPRHRSPVPWQARPYAWSAVVVSSTTITLFGGGAPRSERHRSTRGCPSCVQCTLGIASMSELVVFRARAARLVGRILALVGEHL